MIRASYGNKSYWDKWVSFEEKTICDTYEQIKHPSENPIFRSQYVWLLTKDDVFRLILRRYSRGDDVRELASLLGDVLDTWELSNRLSEEICREHQLKSCRAWVFELSNLNHYNWCFWLVGLALALEIPDEQWQRLLTLIGGEGEDVLLDRIIASRQPQRRIGSGLLHKKPYARLLKAIDASAEQHPALLLYEFVEHWYVELKRRGQNELWWYIYGDPVENPLETGSYFGRWCLEAVAAVKAFGLDDSLCLGHEHYPGDLLRPNGPTTHPLREEPAVVTVKHGWLQKLLGRN